MATTPEGRVKAQVKAALKQRGIYYFMPVSNGMGRMGIPDIIACHQGRFLAVETKAPGKLNHTTPNQKRELHAISEAGGTALVVDDVAQLEEYLDDCLYQEKGVDFQTQTGGAGSTTDGDPPGQDPAP